MALATIQLPIKSVRLLDRARDKGPSLDYLISKPSSDLNHPICGGISVSTRPCSSLLPFALGTTFTRTRIPTKPEYKLTGLFRIGMERLKLPAGRLATIFYRVEPEDSSFDKSSVSSDSEKGIVDEDIHPITVRSRNSIPPSKEFMDREGHVFAWRDICLNIGSGGEKKRLLDNVDGKPSYCSLCGSE